MCIYIYIYIHVVKLLSGPNLALSEVIIWSKYGLLSGPSLFANFIVVSSDFCTLSYHFVCSFCAQLSVNYLILFFRVHFISLF